MYQRFVVFEKQHGDREGIEASPASAALCLPMPSAAPKQCHPVPAHALYCSQAVLRRWTDAVTMMAARLT